MTKYVKLHTKYILEQIENGSTSQELLDYHHVQIHNLQHERLIHLIVLCLFTLLFIGAFVFFILSATIVSMLLAAIFLVVEIFYIRHYYLLENTVQSWYKIENDIIFKINKVGTNFSKQNDI